MDKENKNPMQRMSEYFKESGVFKVPEKPESLIAEERLAVNDPFIFVETVKEGKSEHFTKAKLQRLLEQQVSLSEKQALNYHQEAFDSPYRESMYRQSMKAISTYNAAIDALKNGDN